MGREQNSSKRRAQTTRVKIVKFLFDAFIQLKVTNNDVGIKEKTRLLKLLYTVKGKNEQDIIW